MASSVHTRTPVIHFLPSSISTTANAKTSKQPDSSTYLNSRKRHFNSLWLLNEVKSRRFATLAVANAGELVVLPVHDSGYKEQDSATMTRIDRKGQDSELMWQMIRGFKACLPLDGLVGVAGLVSMAGFSGSGGKLEDGEGGLTALIDRAFNAGIDLGSRSFANTKLLTVDSDCCNVDSDMPSHQATIWTPVLGHGKRTLESFLAAVLLATQVLSPLPNVFLDTFLIAPTNAVLYSPDTKVPRTGELALRRAIPANPSMKSIQESLEGISYLLRIPQRKPYGTMEGSVKKALKIAKEEKISILANVPADLRERGAVLYASLIEGKGGLQDLLGCIKDKDPDRVSIYLASSLDTVAELELLQAPGLQFLLPKQFTEYPTLNGRGLVELTVEKRDGFFTESGGIPKSTATIQIVVDGYSAPLTAGNFAKLVIDGMYDGTKLNCSDQAIISDSKLENNAGFSVPLEIMPSGQFEPLYRTALNVQDGELPVLPLSVYGAVAMAHSDVSEEYSSPDQFFFYLYDKRNAGLGGLSFDEGCFSVFGYTTNGREILSQINSGDIIKSARLLEGRDHLVLTPRGGT